MCMVHSDVRLSGRSMYIESASSESVRGACDALGIISGCCPCE